MSFHRRCFTPLLGLSALALVSSACGGADAPLDVLDGPASAVPVDALDDKADRPDLPLTVVQGFSFSPALGRTETRRLFKSATTFRRYFGQSPPLGVDFNQSWAVFYSAGVVPTRGYVAEVTRVRTTDTGATLKIATRLSTPGAGCNPARDESVASVLVTFPKPAPRLPTSTRFEGAKVERPCAAAVPAAEPQLDSPFDEADRSCALVAREIRRPAGPTGGPETSCATGPCYFVWRGTFDVVEARLVAGVVPKVLFRASSQPGWYEVPATATTGAPAGMRRFAFALSDKTFAEGMSLTSLSRAVLDVWPVLVHTTASPVRRVFAGWQPVVLQSGNGWSLADDPARCAPVAPSRAVLRFRGGSAGEQQQGLLLPGGKLSIEYDLSRLPNCRGTHNGHPAWDMRAFVRFVPGGEILDGTVRGLRAPNGVPTNDAYAVPFEVDVPRDATGAEVWFKNFTGAGSSCVQWDSRFGQNYVYPVSRVRPTSVGWAGDFGGSFARDCAHRDGLAEPIVIDSYVMERACSFVDVDVYVPGWTDGAYRPEGIAAQAELSIDGAAPTYEWLEPVERVGNNVRYRWQLPRDTMRYTAWQRMRFAFRFATDGVTWFRVGQSAGPQGGAPRTIERRF